MSYVSDVSYPRTMPIMLSDGPRMGLQRARHYPGQLLDLIQFGEVRGQTPTPVTLLKKNEPYLLGIHPALWDKVRATKGPAGDPFVIESEASGRRVDWTVVPEGTAAVQIGSRLLQNSWREITQKVVFIGLHLVVARHSDRSAVFVPLDFLD